MARSDDINSAGSQMFIMLGARPDLDGKYSIFGKVLGDGMAQVDKMAVGDGIEYLWVVRDLPEGKR
jgi:cyclophilin family peptidyl-prolyl cis-trans isomerase